MPVDFSGDCRSMDLNGDGSGEQRDRSEESLANVSNGEEKIPQPGNGVKKDEEIASIRSNDSLKNGGARNFGRNQQYRRTSQRRENYAKMCEHRRDSSYQGNFPDRNTFNFVEENIWEGTEPGQHCDNYGDANGAIECDVNAANDLFGICKSGVNISVMSQRQSNCEVIELENPVYNVSFKRCYDSNDPKSDSKRRIFSTRCSRSKKRKTEEASRDQRRPVETAGGSSNFRCTFENCCGNCEPYVMEIRNDDCDSYENWKNSHLGSKNECFEDCCCPRDLKVCSNVSVHPRQSCMACDESQKSSLQPSDCRSASKNCLQRVHFAKAENCPKMDHSSCSFCSRKCTPSKASLFVEIGESVANVLNLTSTQAFACDSSMETLKDETRKKEYGGLKRKKSDPFRSRCKSKKSETRCAPNCKGRPNIAKPCYSDRIDCMNPDDSSIEVPQEAFCPEMLRNVASTTFQDCGAKMESDTHTGKKTTGCSQQCEMNERSLLGDIRKAKIWSQIQDTYKCFMRMATTSIGQLVKQSSKLKRSKKGTRDCSTCGTCTPIGEENISCSNSCDQSQTCSDCLYEETCWQEIHCCGNVCCESIAGLPDCRTPMCQNDYWNGQGQIQSGNDWLLDVYSCDEASPKKLRRQKFGKGRKKGGGESFNQRKRQTNSSKRPNSNPGGQSNALNNRGNAGSKNKVVNQQQEARNPVSYQDEQVGQETVNIDVNVQASSLRTVMNPDSSPYVTAEEMVYQESVKTVKQLGGSPETVTVSSQESRRRESPVIQEIESTLHSLPRKEASKTIKKAPNNLKRRSVQNPGTSKLGLPAVSNNPKPLRSESNNSNRPGTSNQRKEAVQKDKSATKQDKSYARLISVNQGVQCSLIDTNEIVCHSGTRDPSLVADQCVCTFKDGATPAGVDQTYDTIALDDLSLIAVKDNSDKTIIDEPEEIFLEDTIVETPVDMDATEEITIAEVIPSSREQEESLMEEVSVEEDATDETLGRDATRRAYSADVTLTEGTADQSSEVSAPAEVTTTDTDDTFVTVIGDEVPQEVPEETSAEEATQLSLTPATTVSQISTSKIECSELTDMAEVCKDFNGKRVAVSVKIQTSNTILTQILSEFQIGNKKRQVLMSIKLHSDWCNGDEQQSSASSAEEATEVPTRLDNSIFDHRRRMQRPQQTHQPRRSSTYCEICGRRIEENSHLCQIRDAATSTGRRNNLCIGPCGKLMR